MVEKNCRIRKIKKGQPKKAVTYRGFKVLIQPRNLNSINLGMIVTWYGTIIVARTSINKGPPTRHLKRANPKATREEVITSPKIASAVTMQEFTRKMLKGRAVHPSK